MAANASPRVRVGPIDPTTARDVLDAGIDLLVTDDPAIVSYATHRHERLTLPLPWDRTYVVLASESAAPNVIAALRLTLAELVADAVRAIRELGSRLSGCRAAARRLWGRAQSARHANLLVQVRAHGPTSSGAPAHRYVQCRNR